MKVTACRRLRLLAGGCIAFNAFCAGFAFEIPPFPVPVEIAGQSVAFTLAGSIVESPEAPASETSRDSRTKSFELNLRAGLAELQDHMTPLLQAELNRSERCGDRISIENAILTPAAPAAHLAIQLHFEKWVCIKALGKENAKRLTGGNATVQLTVTPETKDGTAVHFAVDVADIDADGSLGEVLRSGSLGAALRDKIRESLIRALQKAIKLEAALPTQAQPFLTLSNAAFGTDPAGRLTLHAAGRLVVPGQDVSGLLEQIRNRRP